MKLKLAVAALALLIATPTFAAEYYIIQSASSKKCAVASKKPTSDEATLVGDGTAYKTKKEARTALKAADACKATAGGIEPPAIRRAEHASLRRHPHP